jgi:hypothetical protein
MNHTTLGSFPHLSFTTKYFVKLLETTLSFIGKDCRDFPKIHDNDLDLLLDFLDNFVVVLEDITTIQVDSFRNPFQEIAWLFTRMKGKESIATIS